MAKKKSKKINYKKPYTGDRLVYLPCGVFVTEDMLLPEAVMKLRLGELYPENKN